MTYPTPTIKIPRWLKVIWWAYFLFLVMLLTSCASPPAPQHDAAVDQAWARFLLCELPPEQRPEGCE